LYFAVPFEGHARLLIHEVFKVRIKGGRTVRWWCAWEKKVKVSTHITMARFITDVVDVCIAKKWSLKSATKMKWFLKKPETQALVITEQAAEADGGRLPCQATYDLEGKGFIVAVAWTIFERLDEALEAFDAGTDAMPLLQSAAAQAEAIMAPVLQALKDDVMAAREVVTTLETAAARGGNADAGNNLVAPDGKAEDGPASMQVDHAGKAEVDNTGKADMHDTGKAEVDNVLPAMAAGDPVAAVMEIDAAAAAPVAAVMKIDTAAGAPVAAVMENDAA
jgi:hypothetical protein